MDEEVKRMENIKVSVVIPICGQEVHFRDCLDNLLNQTLKEAEFLMINDGQADNFVDIEKEYQEIDSRFIFINEPAGVAKNVGMQRAKGKYILFLAENNTLDHEALEKVYHQAEEQNAQLVWFKSKRKNINTGESATLDYAFRKHQLPKNEVFAFSEIKGNPFTAFNGWLWDKMFDTEYISNLGLAFQDPSISKDDYFTTMAMVNACRIATLEEALVTQNRGHENIMPQISENENNILEEETNLPQELEEENNNIQHLEDEETVSHVSEEDYECEYNTLLAIIRELEKDQAKKEMLLQYRIVTINHLVWLIGNGFNSRQAAMDFCKLLSQQGLEALGIFEVKLDTLSYYEEQNLLILRQLKEYGTKIGKFEKEVFMELAGTKLSGSATVIELIEEEEDIDEVSQEAHEEASTLSLVYKERGGRYIFGQDETSGENTVASLFSITLQHRPRNNISLSVDFIYMDRYAPLVKNTLNLSLSLKETHAGQLERVMHQAEWEKSEEVFLKNIYYTFKENVLTIFAKYTEINTGFEYKINMISTRSRKEMFTLSESDQEYGTKPLSPIDGGHVPIKTVSKESGLNLELYYGTKAIFKTDATDAEGVDLLAIELTEIAWNGISFAVDITYLKKEGIAIYDTLYCSFRIREYEGKLEGRVTQAEWKHGYKPLSDNIYYRIENNILYIGGRYNGIWNGYVYKVTHVACRRTNEDYFITNLADDAVTVGLNTITEEIFIENKVDWDL